jgi:hypothetical protein
VETWEKLLLAGSKVVSGSWDKQDKHKSGYRNLPIEEKESYRWISSGKTTKELLEKQCAHLTVIGDRESDIVVKH